MSEVTIAAIATALSNSGISIIRVSGDEAIDIVDKIFRSKTGSVLKDYDSNTINYGFIYDKNELVDEVMVSLMRAPASYTKENVVEINTHGGVLITKKVLSLVIKNGARLAEPGEFTKRAFLNGRIDLSQAEAIMDMIGAQNDLALKTGINALRGNVSNEIKRLREELIYDIAYIESALDDPEHISLDGYYDSLSGKIDNIFDRLNKLSKSAENGRIIREGISTVILGKPNAGKSTLMNVLIGEDRAIVTDIEGTTRDSLEESLRIGNVSLRLIDTAGIRETKDTVERIGVDRAVSLAKDADLILYVIDSSRKLDDNDYNIINLSSGKRMIVLYNKNDLTPAVSIDEIKSVLNKHNYKEEDYDIISISSKEEIGIDDLMNKVESIFIDGSIDYSNEIMITNMRHKEHIDNAINSLMLVRNSINDNMPEDFLTIDMMSAYSSLGLIIGEEVDDDLVNEIFGKFCMGK